MSTHRPDILLHSGNFFNFRTPDTSIITIEDIANGLANESRFNGQTFEFYSVAQHSVIVSLIVPPAWAWAALFHDCAESVMKDMPKPLKRILPDYQALEATIEASLFALATEKRDLMPPHDSDELPDMLPLAERIIPMPPRKARTYFMDRYHELLGERAGVAA